MPDTMRKKLQFRQADGTRRLTPMLRALKALHDASMPDGLSLEELERRRRGQDLLGRIAAPHAGLSWKEFTVGRLPAAWIRPKEEDSGRVILYCHGGGYTSGNLGYSQMLGSRMAQAGKTSVFCFEYRLAPEHPYPAALSDALFAWNYLMLTGRRACDIILAGDSAGGNLALALCHRLRTARRSLPGALVLMSPWTDMTMSGASYRERADSDPMLTPEYIQNIRDCYAGEADLHSPYLSPLFGDFTDFPPTLIQVGGHEILYDDAASLCEKMRQQGVSAQFEVYEEMWHVFQMFPTKSSADALEHIGSFLNESC